MDIKKQVECYIEERKYSTLQQASIVASALVAITMAAMNQNMVAAALGGIVGEFKMGQVTWVAGAYLLTLTAFQPLYGKFSDIFGRGPTLIAAMCMFMAGSAGCGLAQGPYSLIGWRSISGIGAGGLLTLPFIIISDMVALEKRSMYMGFIQITFGVCSVIGPLLGGAFVDMLSWRWVFFFSVPMSIVGLVVVSLMPSSKIGSTLPLATKLTRIDMAGTATLLAGTVFLMFGLNVGGKDYAWNSAQVLSSLGLGVLLLLIFLFVELRVAEEPIVPFRMLNRNTLAVAGTSFSLGFTMSTAINYIPLYHQTAQARSFTHAGIHSIVFLLAISISAAGSGMLIKKPNHHRILMWVGMAMVAICNALGAFIRQDISQAEEVGFALFIGLGVGLNIQVVLIMAQAFTLPEGNISYLLN
ncbi:hypothetical protein DSO57_1023389 [Entomophthora muscae]|uniref:Uncharacterized protein n=1 Tax=Entomophthora muscae TaxID=34485 RepID=A0ACC2SFU6_9FUNG|nr:hypothetical protein DSO57_1023389 [Entomophthora muscae]